MRRYATFMIVPWFLAPTHANANTPVDKVVGYLFNLEASERPQERIHDGKQLASNASKQTANSVEAWRG